MLHNCVLIALLVLGVFGCTKPATETPKEVLSAYVNLAFGVKSIGDIAGLKDFTTDSAREDLEKLETDAKLGDQGQQLFKKAFEDQKIESTSSLKIRDERVLGDEGYSITYELAYHVKSANTEDKVTTKKHALFTFDKSRKRWLIKDVQGLKTFVEHTAEERISADPGKKN
ncbi:MAG: hypothetical protein HY074_07665 [Deltaproteobacteria bacterium]|nr:hypothetical protein [Deltaproteobacteria bacterium]